jgi:hypothetical protein
MTWLDEQRLLETFRKLLNPNFRDPPISPLMRAILKHKKIAPLIWAKVRVSLVPFRGFSPNQIPFHKIPCDQISGDTLTVIREIILESREIIIQIISTKKLRCLIQVEEPLFVKEVIFTSDALAVFVSLFSSCGSREGGQKGLKNPNPGRILARLRNKVRNANEFDYWDLLSQCQELLLLKFPTYDSNISPFGAWFLAYIVETVAKGYWKTWEENSHNVSLSVMAADSLTSQPPSQVRDDILPILLQLHREAVQGTLTAEALPGRLREKLSSAGFEVADDPAKRQLQDQRANRTLLVLRDEKLGRRLLIALGRVKIKRKRYREIAQELGISVVNARQEFCNCKRQIAKILRHYISTFDPNT